MKLSKTINVLKWGFAVAVFGVAVYAIYQGWIYLKGLSNKAVELVKPSQYKRGATQTTFEKLFPNIAEVKDKALDAFKENPVMPIVPFMQSFFEEKKPVVSQATEKTTAKAIVGQEAKVLIEPVPEPKKSIIESVAEFFTPEPIKVVTSGKEIKPIAYNNPGDDLSLSPPKQMATKVKVLPVQKVAPVRASIER